MVSRGECERQVRIILQRLLKVGGWLACREGRWGLHSPRNGHGRPVMEPPAEIVDAMIGAALLREKGGRWRPTKAATDWLCARMPMAQQMHKARETRDIVDPDGLRRRVEAAAESPLEWLARRKGRDGRPFISATQFAAGERLRRDYEAGMRGPRVTASWDGAFAASERRRVRARPHDGIDVSERAMAARERVHAALDAVGEELAAILLEVCCLSRGMEAAERRLGWPRRSGRLVLRIALQRLAEHYGMTQARRGRQRRILLWGLPDHAPARALPEGMGAAEG